MKIVLVHNEYGAFSGEEKVVEQQRVLLEAQGHQVIPFRRRSAEIPAMHFGRLKAFFGGIYNPAARGQFRHLLQRERPDLVHIHNLFPLISPSILPECRRAGIPVVMTVHNFRLICPTGLFYARGQICERCRHGGGEAWCVIKNCAGERTKSLGYAVRNWTARMLKIYQKNVSLFLTLNEFQRGKLIHAGFAPEKIKVLPNALDMETRPTRQGDGDYVGFIGRISPEKGIAVLQGATELLPAVPFVLAGEKVATVNGSFDGRANVECWGHVAGERLEQFWAGARFIVLPSLCYEGFPMVIIEALARGIPVICSRIGGLPEIIEDGCTGLLAIPGDVLAFAERINYLWERPKLVQKMGIHCRQAFEQRYSSPQYYQRLNEMYSELIKYNETRRHV